MKLTRQEKDGQIIIQPKLSLFDKFRRYPILMILFFFWVLPVTAFAGIFVTALIANLGSAELQELSLADLPIIAIVLIVMVFGPMLPFVFVGRFPKIIFGSNYRTMIVGKRYQITTTRDDSVILHRTLIKVRQYYSSSSSRRRRSRFGFTYHVVWSVSYQPAGQQPVLLARYQMDKGDGFDELAETLAEVLHIPLIDKSGRIEEIREPGTTDVFVGKLVKQDKIGEYSEINLRTINATPASEFLRVEMKEGGYRLMFLKDPWRLGMIFKMLFAIIIIFGGGLFIYTGWFLLEEMFNELAATTGASNPLTALVLGIFLPFAIMMIILSLIAIIGGIALVIGGLVMISGARTWYIVDFTPQKVDSKRRGLLLIPRRLRQFQTRLIERVVVFQYRKGGYCVELMSDKGRLPYNGSYTLEDTILLRNIFLTIFAKFAG
ncbi:MAG: hypothetical protein ACFFD4_16805 [Candidatus Odinarchaeota archaeon]